MTERPMEPRLVLPEDIKQRSVTISYGGGVPSTTWTLFDFQDKATWPPDGQPVLVYGLPGDGDDTIIIGSYRHPIGYPDEDEDDCWCISGRYKLDFQTKWWTLLPVPPPLIAQDSSDA